MSRNGSGTYTLPSGNPFVPSTVISSTTMNNTMSDIATALTQSIANDGQTTPVANLPMATFRHTNVGNAVARNDYAAAGQAQDSSLQWLTSVSGTDTITASLTPSPSAYAAGQTFRFIATGNNTTAAPTLNINGLGAKTITRLGTQGLVAGDILAGSTVTVIYDGTRFQVLGILSSGAIIGAARNVIMNVSSASATATLTADELILETALGGVSYKLTSFNKSVNLATTGAGGMDTGAAPVSGYVALYAIYNPTTGASALLAQNATSSVVGDIYGGANMPSGYTASALVSVWPTNGSSQFIAASQLDRTLTFGYISALSTSALVGATSLVLPVPKNAKFCGGLLVITIGTTSATSIAVGSGSSPTQQLAGTLPSVPANLQAPFNNLLIQSTTPQTIFYSTVGSGGGNTFQIFISQYTF